MADVQIQQPSGGSGGASWAWAIVVIALLVVVGWLVLGGGLHKTSTTKVEINAPGAAAPSGGGDAKKP